MGTIPTRIQEVTRPQVTALAIIAETRSWERTRKELGAASPTSVMHLLERMAKTIGTGPLVTGKGDSVELTSSGSEYLLAAQNLRSAFLAFNDAPFELQVSGYPIHAAILVPLVASFKDPNGSAEVKFHKVSDESRNDRGAELVQRLIDGELDIVVAPSGRGNATLAERKFYEWNLRVVLSKSDSHRWDERIRIAELREYRFLVAPKGHMSRELFDRMALEANVRANIYMEVSDQNVLREVATYFEKCAAIIPDDAFGLPDTRLGPVLLRSKGANVRQGYSLYYKRSNKGDTPLIRRRNQQVSNLVTWIEDELPVAWSKLK